MQKPGRLMLASGLEFSGNCLYEGEDLFGEIVFSTANTGYTEILTDPSYYGQIVVFAHPEIGNYGVNTDDFQSNGIKAKALIVRNLSPCTSSFRAHMTLTDFLLREGVPVLYGIDTRALIAHLRDYGSTMGVLSTDKAKSSIKLLQLAKEAKPLNEQKLSNAVSVKEAQTNELCHVDILGRTIPRASERFHVVALDFGIKHAILRYLDFYGISVSLVPNNSSPEEIWAMKPDGLFLSNGPGDPENEIVAIETVRALLGKLPIFGVCMGHQVLAKSLGYQTFKLKFGHRGSNQAVRRIDASIITTAQNHGFAIQPGSIEKFAVDEDINLADGTNEGLDIPSLCAFSVQFHPEGAPGPKDSLIYFEKFAANLSAWRRARASAPTAEASKCS